MSGLFQNIYHLRRVADTAAKACYVCHKPSSSVMITPDNKVNTIYALSKKKNIARLVWNSISNIAVGFLLHLSHSSEGSAFLLSYR